MWGKDLSEDLLFDLASNIRERSLTCVARQYIYSRRITKWTACVLKCYFKITLIGTKEQKVMVPGCFLLRRHFRVQSISTKFLT